MTKQLVTYWMSTPIYCVFSDGIWDCDCFSVLPLMHAMRCGLLLAFLACPSTEPLLSLTYVSSCSNFSHFGVLYDAVFYPLIVYLVVGYYIAR